MPIDDDLYAALQPHPPADDYSTGIYAGAYNPLGPIARAAGKVATVAQEIPAGMIHSAISAVTLPGDVYAGDASPYDLGRAMDFAGTVTGGAGVVPAEGNELRAGVTAYHGSPHDFDRFDISRIGTGEGAQAYGHGLYFAGNEDIAKTYRDSLSNHVLVDGQPFTGHPSDGPLASAQHAVLLDVQKGMDPARSIARQEVKWRAQAQPYLDFAQTNPEHAEQAMAHAQSFNDVADATAALDPASFVKNPGHMYEVNLQADPEHFLDYDRPLHEQSPHVQQALNSIGIDTAKPNPDMDALRQKATAITKMIEAPPQAADWVRDYMFDARQQIKAAKTPQAVYDTLKDAPVFYGFYPSSATMSRAAMEMQSKIHPAELQDQIMNGLGDLRAATRPPATGYDMLGALESRFGSPAHTSQALHEAGVPGIRYLDASSRGDAANPTHNYVAFSDHIVNVVRKYGLVGAVSAGLLTSEQAAQYAKQQQGNADWAANGGT